MSLDTDQSQSIVLVSSLLRSGLEESKHCTSGWYDTLWNLRVRKQFDGCSWSSGAGKLCASSVFHKKQYCWVRIRYHIAIAAMRELSCEHLSRASSKCTHYVNDTLVLGVIHLLHFLNICEMSLKIPGINKLWKICCVEYSDSGAWCPECLLKPVL